MAAPTSFEPYVPNSIPFSQYIEQLEYVFMINKVREADYKHYFLAVCGTTVFSEVKKLFPGQDLKILTYKQITEKLQKRYDNCYSEVMHSCEFWSRRQEKCEKLEDFLDSVKRLAEQCGFGNFKDRAIRDLLVVGVYNKDLRKRLCDESVLTAAEAEKIILNHKMSSNKILNGDEERNASILTSLYPSEVPSRSRQARGERSSSGARSLSAIHRTETDRFCTYCRKNNHRKDYCYKLKLDAIRQAGVKLQSSPKPSTSSL